MDKKTQEYKEWIKWRNYKELIRRTQKKKWKKSADKRRIEDNTRLKQNHKTDTYSNPHSFVAPITFSFIENYHETNIFFQDILAFSNHKKSSKRMAFIDISKVSVLTIDALLYLIAIISDSNNSTRRHCSIAGNIPDNPLIRRKFEESGIYKFVKSSTNAPINRTVDNIQIISGETCNTLLAKRISDFIVEKTHIEPRECGFLYCIMIELMSNTHKHAYNISIKYPRWYCYVEYSKNEKLLRFTFMDTGEGIPATVRKNFKERIDLLNLTDENKYIISALSGEFRTSTRQSNRGKGLPSIKECCDKKYINNLKIISNYAEVSYSSDRLSGKDHKTLFRGTLFYWEIDLKRIKEKKSNDN